ncbi:MAG: aminotransferase class V-fold PLP-dependent enzyme [Planctomycetota bacterium]|nr:aminotransferase class V-fold PLP-dependent enzyme [Planctomycetota bacterium]
MNSRIYLDNAATSFPKPEAVYRAVETYHRELGTAVGRGAYRVSIAVSQKLRSCRNRAAVLLGAESPERIVFTFNGTDSLNTVIHGLFSQQSGGHVVTTAAEHNSVLRPLRMLERRKHCDVSVVPLDDVGRFASGDIERALRRETRLVAITHVSNVTGTVQPIEEVVEVCRLRRIPVLLDAAQSAGHLPIDLKTLPVDFLACPGHKGLFGPLGTGILYIRSGLEDRVDSIRQGGTGTQSELDEQPSEVPEKYESGNHNAPGLVGLDEGLAYVQERTVIMLHEHELTLTAQLLEGLNGISKVTVYGPREIEGRVGVVSFNVAGYSSQDVAAILDASTGIEVRSGLHCAPLIHRALGTAERGGTVRISIGGMNTADDIDRAIDAIRQL